MSFRAKFVVLDPPDESLASLLTPPSGQTQSIPKCRRFPCVSVVVLFVFFLCIRSNGRTDPQANTSTFQATTELVSVPVVVKDQHGNRVHGLTKDDFHILENGHQVEIRSFESILNPGVPTTARGPAKVQIVVSQSIGSVPIILFFDQLNTPANEQSEVRRRLALWYRSQQTLAAPTCVILYTGSVLQIVQQPTVAATKVRAAIESIPTTVNSHGAGATGELPLPAGAIDMVDEDETLRTIERLLYFRDRAIGASDTQSALIYAGRLFAAWPGEKALVWVTAGTTTNIWTVPLQAAQVKVYPLDVHTKIPYEFIASFTRPDTTYQYETEVNNQLLQNMRDVAQQTGGELCGTSVEPQSCMQRVMEDATDYYLLSYETHSRSNKPELRQIRVKVDRPGVTVAARNSVLVDPTIGTAEEKRERIAATLASPVDLPGLRLELLPFPPHQPGQRFMLSLLMRSDVEHPGVWSSGAIDFTVVGIVVCGSDVLEHFGEDVHGKVSPKIASDLDRTGLTWTHKIVVPTGASAVRLVVRDNTTGSIGSITQTIP